jgi:peptidoglycan/xylan/chitin deacetylase (PgdA/CDA1 family)
VKEMYRCYNFKRFLVLLFCDAAVFSLLYFFFNFNSAADTEDKGIFLPVIMYHSILPDNSESTEYIVKPETVENDLKYLKENGYETVLPRDLVNYVYFNVPLPENPVMITLDDGSYNNMYYLLPLLEKYDMYANINIVGEYSEFFSENGEEHIEKYSYLTWDDINALSKTGRFEIGNHTYSLHKNTDRKGCAKFSYETYNEYSELLTEDVTKLQKILTKKSEVTPITFAYPFGYISKESIPILKKAGFKVTLTCYEKANYITENEDSLYGINRYNRPDNISTEKFMEKILAQ